MSWVAWCISSLVCKDIVRSGFVEYTLDCYSNLNTEYNRLIYARN